MTSGEAGYVKPRALIVDIFGDYLQTVGPEVRAGELVTLLGALGVEPATVRVTLSRLRAEGWFTTRRAGRETFYRLSPRILDVLASGRERIFAPYRDEWDGWWTQVVVQMPESDRALREQIRKKLAWLGFGPLAPSIWMSPRAGVIDAEAFVEEFPPARIDVLRARTDDADKDRDIARRCWDLELLNADYAAFIDAHADLAGSASSLRGDEAMAARTRLVSTYRHFPFRDPVLPAALRPEGWRGPEANRLFLDLHAALAEAAEAYVSAVVEPVEGFTTKT